MCVANGQQQQTPRQMQLANQPGFNPMREAQENNLASARYDALRASQAPTQPTPTGTGGFRGAGGGSWRGGPSLGDVMHPTNPNPPAPTLGPIPQQPGMPYSIPQPIPWGMPSWASYSSMPDISPGAMQPTWNPVTQQWQQPQQTFPNNPWLVTPQSLNSTKLPGVNTSGSGQGNSNGQQQLQQSNGISAQLAQWLQALYTQSQRQAAGAGQGGYYYVPYNNLSGG